MCKPDFAYWDTCTETTAVIEVTYMYYQITADNLRLSPNQDVRYAKFQ